MSKELWWGYRHTTGALQVKRFFNFADIYEAQASQFVDMVRGPFLADDREEAIKNLQNLLDGKRL